MIATYALYPWFPIACEGDDPMTDTVSVETKCPATTRDELEQVHGGYVQLWDVTGS